MVEKPQAVFNAEKKLFNPAQVALTKIPRNEADIYQKLSSEAGTFIDFSWLLPDLSLNVEQVRFAS